MSMSGDGTVLVVGAYAESNGRVYSYDCSGTSCTWAQTIDPVNPLTALGVYFGYTASISADGTKLAIGGPVDNSYTGAVWMYNRATGATWTYVNKIIGYTNSQFGWSVALSSGGSRMMIGAPYTSSFVGTAYYYVNGVPGGTLSFPSVIGTAHNGYAVALDAVGSVTASSGYADNSLGAAWVNVLNTPAPTLSPSLPTPAPSKAPTFTPTVSPTFLS